MTRFRASLFVLSVLMAGLLAACSGGGLSGTWSGTAVSSYGSYSDSITVHLSQSGSNLSGSWSGLYDSGSVSGTVSGSDVVVSLSCTTYSGDSVVVNATTSGNTISGSYSGGCGGYDQGDFSVTKQ